MDSKEILPGWLRTHRRVLLGLIDAVLIALALALAYFIRGLEELGWSQDFHDQYRALLPVVLIAQIALFALFHLYRGLLRYAGITEVKVIVSATTVVAAAMLLLFYMAPHIEGLGSTWPVEQKDGHQQVLPIPRQVIVVYWLLAIFFVGGFRFSRRLVLSTFRRRDGRNVIIVGVVAGESAAREMLHHPEDGYDPVGFVDPSPLHVGRRVHGLRVWGTVADLSRVIVEQAAQEVVIALPEAGGRQIREIADICRAQNAQAKILPSVSKIISGQVSVSAIRPVTIEDVLGREPVDLKLSDEMNYIQGKRVLVTGAGGSIGGELVRQILRLKPDKVVLLGRGENTLFEFAAELGIGCEDERLPIVIGNICDEAKMRWVFERHRPHVVFHAAAHKHVPYMETNPEEAIKNNVFGTRVMAQLAAEFGAERFILISTDKAVRPTSMLGASKRLGEMVVWDVAARAAGSAGDKKPKTRFMAVRFGNVLGSRGSVVPTLKRQIEDGGPVTITHRDMTRYFMTIPEAASLVAQAGALGDGGRLFVLDMGEPVRIIDLVHNLVTLSGFRPDEDIEIKETGARPGEKIFEELLTDDESLKATQFGKIFVIEPEPVDSEALGAALDRLERAATECDRETITSIMRELVPDYGGQTPRATDT